MIEEWRPIEGYEGLYEVSNTGQVRSLDRYVKNNYSYRLQKGKVLSPEKNKDGYLLVSLCCNGKQNLRTVHRLVAQAFIPNPNNLPQVNHKDENKSNNRVDNLEWCDQAYNNLYGTRQERYRNTMLERGYCTGLSRKEYMKKYYQENRDGICERQKEYYRKKKEIQNNVKSLNDQI